MGTENKIWVVIASQNISQKINDLVDAGYFAEARDLDYQLKSINDKTKSFISERGGQIHLAIYEKIVLELPYSIAEDLPNTVLIGYKQFFGGLMAVGLGLDLREAILASKKSMMSSHIEMYDPEDESMKEFRKSLQIESDLFPDTPPNIYDKTNPKSPQPSAQDQHKVDKFVPAANAQTALKLENDMIQATVQQLNAGAEQVQQQAEQQMQQMQAQAAQQQPQNLGEALNGGPVEGQEKEEKKPKVGEKEMSESKGSSEKSSDSSEENDEDGEDSKETEKLAQLLEMVNDKIPKLSGLAEKNPEAFKKVIGLVHKIVDMAKDKKKVEKKEVDDLTEDLNKAIAGMYPVGTVKHGKKKVMIDNKATWRSVRAGQVKDLKGNPISVASHNDKADDGNQGVK